MMETIAILLYWNDEYETSDDTIVKTSFDTSQFDCEISRLTLVLYDNIFELYFTQFMEIKLNNSLNISMVFMCLGGLVPSAMNSSFTESRGSSIVLAVLLSLLNQNDLELENDTNTTNNNNNDQTTGQSDTDISSNTENNNHNQKEKNSEVSQTDNIGICELFGKHIRL